MTIASIVAAVTLILSLPTKFIGLPDQIRSNYKRKSTAGLSLSYYLIAFLSYISWTLHGYFQRDLVVVLAQLLGVLTTGIILLQMFIYRSAPSSE
jgi:uncharacterized protein with PQ loop repeat